MKHYTRNEPYGSLARVGLFLSAIALSACANVSHMLLYQDTSLGIKGGLNPETNTASIHVGFRRNFATIVPKVKETENGQPTGEMEAASVYSASKMVIRGLQLPDIDETVVTGDAAYALGQSADALDPFKPKANGASSNDNSTNNTGGNSR
jgi:hypothetical protein